MPLYEYECESCGRRFERIQKFSDPPVETCPHCGGKVRKLISSPAIQFKGSGWYITDYSKKGSSESSKKDSGESAKGSESASTDKSSGASTSDAKPAASSGSNAGDTKPAKS